MQIMRLTLLYSCLTLLLLYHKEQGTRLLLEFSIMTPLDTFLVNCILLSLGSSQPPSRMALSSFVAARMGQGGTIVSVSRSCWPRLSPWRKWLQVFSTICNTVADVKEVKEHVCDCETAQFLLPVQLLCPSILQSPHFADLLLRNVERGDSSKNSSRF